MISKQFLKLDEDLFQDEKVRLLLRKGGFQAFGHFVALLTVFRRYQQHLYKIPFDQLSEIAEWDLHCDAEELDASVQLCIDVGLFMDDGIMFWSERRCKDLIEQDEKLSARKENAARTNAIRKQKKKESDAYKASTLIDGYSGPPV